MGLRSPLIASIEQELATKRTEGLALLAATAQRAEKENREWTDDERAAIKKYQDEGLALKARLAKLQGDDDMIAEIERLTATARPPADRGKLLKFKSMGEQFISSQQYDFFRKGQHRTGSAWRSESIELFAATLTEDPASGGALVLPQQLPGIMPIPQRPLLVGQLFAPGTTDSNAVSYMREKTWVNAAAPVAEGALKPESTLTFEAVTDPVRKIAHWLPVSEEMLEDQAQIRSYIDARLQLGVQMEEDDQLLNGTGVAPELLGLLLRPGLAADVARVDPMTNADAMFKQMMAIFATSFLMPDGHIMNPVNWTATVLSKTSTGEYFTGGPFSPVQTPTLWGLPVAVTPATAAGVGVTGAFKTAGQVFRHGGIRVEASNSHADFFIKNLVAIRAEERLALAVYRPGSFGKVTGLSAA
jgi:HK97 family phage major capsid protein